MVTLLIKSQDEITPSRSLVVFFPSIVAMGEPRHSSQGEDLFGGQAIRTAY